MDNTNKEFFDLLNTFASELTFSLELCPREESVDLPVVTCKQLNTSQLKKLIETVVDSPLTQSSFNSTSTAVFKESVVAPSEESLNIIDRLLFILETRAQSLSPIMTTKQEGKIVTVDIKKISENLKQELKSNYKLLLPVTVTEGKLTIKFGVALLSADTQLNEEIYKNLNPNVENADELRDLLGSSFINEIAKSIQSISIGESILDLSTVNFKSRLQAIGQLPASLIQKVIEYIENYKKIIDSCLTVNNYSITIDGSLFSVR